jgi:hypothetical protein
VCCVSYIKKKQNNTKKCSLCCFFCCCCSVCMYVFLAQVFEKDSDTHSYVLSLFFLCVCFARTSCPFLKKNSTIQHITRSFCCFFLAFCFIVHTGLFLCLSLSHFIREKLCISFVFFFFPISFCCFCFGLMMMMMIMYMVCIL